MAKLINNPFLHLEKSEKQQLTTEWYDRVRAALPRYTLLVVIEGKRYIEEFWDYKEVLNYIEDRAYDNLDSAVLMDHLLKPICWFDQHGEVVLTREDVEGLEVDFC